MSPVLAADAGTLLSPAVLAHASGGNPAANTAGQAQLLNSQALQAQQALSAANLARAAKTIADMTAAQAAATASSQLTLGNANLSGSSWNGTPLSGLNPRDKDPTLWINADPLQKDAASATATVKQNAATALLTWQSFDLNKGERLVFDQQGNADWTVLNRVVAGPRDASGSRFVASPSMILGAIQAPGSVYVINPNGVVFGPTAQINVHSLIASSLDVGAPTMSIGERNSFFLNTGILGTGGTSPSESFSYNPNDTALEGDVVVQAGAKITTDLAPRAISPDAGGFVYLFAPHVENRGTITTPAGETLMVAAQAVQLIAQAYPDAFPAATPDTFRAVGVNTTATGSYGNVQINNAPIVWRTDGPPSAQITTPGTVTNSGLIDAERGIVILNGDVVTNGSAGGSGPGVIRANTSITRNGQIYLDGRFALNVSGSIQILPTENGETIPDSALDNFSPGTVEMHGLTITLDSGALIEAPGANISATVPDLLHGIYPTAIDPIFKNLPTGRFYMASASTIDVSGLLNVERPLSDNFLTFKPFGNEFADQPLQRNGALRGQSLTVDLRQSGTLNGSSWIGTPLANLAGYATSAPRTIDQLLTTGGNVSLSSSTGQVVLRKGSAINVGGGSVQYQAGVNSASKLVTADGRIVSISRADPQETYIGVAGVSTLEHPHWGATTTETFQTPLLAGEVLEPGYTEGHDAGTVSLNALAYIVEGDLYGGVVSGERQRALGQRPTANDGVLTMPNAGAFAIQGVNNLTISGTVTPLAASFTASTPLPSAAIDTTVLSSQKLSDAGFGEIEAAFPGQLLVTADATLTAAPGGTITLSAGSVDIEGNLVAPSGSISVKSTAHVSGDPIDGAGTSFQPLDPARSHQFDLVIGSQARLDVSGLWVNDNGALPADLIGGAYIDGGSISLQTDARSGRCQTSACTSLAGLGAGVPANVDLTGDIVLSQGALLDASSGGRITDRGLLALDSKGRVAGKGGNISLVVYGGKGFSTGGGGAPVPVTTGPLTATIRLPGSDGQANASALAQVLHAYGFAQGGTLTLQTPSLDIDSAGVANGSGDLVLPASFFDGNGFGAYNLSTIGYHLAVAPNTTLTLRQRNLVPGNDLAALASGAKVSQIESVGFMPDFLRQPVDLNLSATLSVNPAGPYDPAVPTLASAAALSLGSGASVQADPGAKVSINVAGRTFYDNNDPNNPFPAAIAAQTAVAEILGPISAPGGSIAMTAGSNSQLWLGANGRLDVSGVALTDPRQTLFRSGTVLSGGSVSITATVTGASVVGLHGALIDVSGASGVFDLPADSIPTLAGQQTVATTIWSDAGSISLKAPTLLYDGAFVARGGSASANGGTLTIASTAPSARLTVRQSGDAVPAGLKPGDALGTLAGSVVFLADRLDGSGIQTLDLSAGLSAGDTVGTGGAGGRIQLGPVVFSGNVHIGGLNRLLLDMGQIALTNTVAPTDALGCNVCLDARYVALRGAGNTNQVFPAAGKGILRVAGDTIDIAAGGGVFSGDSDLMSISGAAQSNFVSAGDIRLRTPLANTATDLTPGTLAVGELITAGDLSMTAAQIYPVSGVSFTLKSMAPKGAITFAANGAPRSAPLSAGGQLTVSAAHIQQNGVLLAPLGVIRLGAQTSADLTSTEPEGSAVIPTQSVTFGAGSITSVSLAGQSVPFGQTANGASWSYDSSTGQPLTEAPAKDLVISAAAIDLKSGATIGLTGGGDLQAIEFVPGTGGTRDVLAGSAVFAVIPGYNPAAAPVDLDFLLQRHDSLPQNGAQVYLSGLGGLPAGFYTLLPAHYASLPGAYRVTAVSNSTDALSHLNQTLPDGTLRMAGYFANSSAGTRDARLKYFDVQSSTVWRQYSEIDQTGANAFFGASANVARLPVDAGHAVLNAISAINLQGKILSAPAAKGRAGEMDIVAQDIQVLSPGATARSGYVGLDATQVSNLDVESLMLGGIRSDTDDGEAVNVVSTSIEVSNDASAPLERPEVILVTRVGTAAVDPNASRRLMLDAGSVVQATGAVVDPTPKKLIIGNNALNTPGNGSLVAVSNGDGIIVERQQVSQTNGTLTLAGPITGTTDPGATLRGNSLALDTSGNIRPGTNVTLAAKNISISAKSINFGTAQTNAGFNISGNIASQLQRASNLTLHSWLTTDFSGPVDFSLGANSHLTLDSSALVSRTASGAVHLGAGSIDLINTGDGQNPSAAGKATLTLTASTITFGKGTKSLSGFGSATVSASSQVRMQDTGSFDGGASDLTFQTPLVLVASRADQSVTTSGKVQLAGTGVSAAVQDGEFGGSLTVNAGSIDMTGSTLQAMAGAVTLTAASGNITLGSKAAIRASGFVSTFFDVTRVAGGGSVQLSADQGSIDIDPTAAIDVSSPVGQPGYAGQIVLRAANGDIRSGGGVFDMAVIAGSVSGDGGGRLTIDTRGLGSGLIALPGMFDSAIDLHLRQGNVEIVSDIKAATVSLTIDGGNLTISHAIDASGEKGGSISLFGSKGVTLTSSAQLLATASDALKRGADVLIGTAETGTLDLQGGVINVSNTANPANGGTVRLRAPLTGQAFDDVAINPVGTQIRGATSVTIEGYRVFKAVDPTSAGYNPVTDFNGVIDPQAQPGFYGSCTAQGVCSGTLIDFVQKFALSAAQGKFSGISAAILHLQPGIELVNDNTGVNNGDITVANAWNLGSGLAGFLVSAVDYAPKNKPKVPAGTVMTDANGNLLPQYAGYKDALLFVPGTSQIHSLFYRVGGSVTGEAGTLTLRAVRDVNVNDSITDGFFNTRNVFEPGYQKSLNSWINSIYQADGNSTDISNVGGYLIAGSSYAISGAPQAPYDAAANGISPGFSSHDKTPIAGADLFPLIADPTGPIAGADPNNPANYRAIDSWSYRIVAGADTASANPLAVQPLTVFTTGGASAGHGNVVLDGHISFTVNNALGVNVKVTSYVTPTIVRTGTGSIDIAAGLDFILKDQKAPGVIYTAGRNSVDLPDPGFALQTIANPFDATQPLTIPVAADPTGFLKPVVVTCDLNFSCSPYGPPTQAAYPVGGGHLTLTAQRDIIGFEHPHLGTSSTAQYFAPWLLAQGTTLASSDAGAFSPLSAYLASFGNNLFTPSQTSWWINFGSFDQGLMSVGGDVTVKAGRDIQELSVSLPTTVRVSGGLVDAKGEKAAPVVHFNGSGDLTVIAGRDLKSGAYYEGSGDATIIVGGAISASWSIRDNPADTTSVTHPVSTVLAVDTGRIALKARGDIDLAGIVSAASLQDVADFTGNLDVQSQSVSSYGPSSAVSLLSAGGDITANSLSLDIALAYNLVVPGNAAGTTGREIGTAFPGNGLYPASFEAVAANGDIHIAKPFQLASSDNGTLNLLAHDSLVATAPAGIRNSARPISTGPSVTEIAFDPVHPLSGFAPPSGSVAQDLGAQLLHQGDAVPERLYAATGDITSRPEDLASIALAWEITKSAKIQAAGDIIDLSFFGQNLAATDVTSIVAGRDIVYTGAWQNQLNNPSGGVPQLGAYQNLGGLSLAGPGFFEIQAGRNLGPFVTAAADVAAGRPGVVKSDPIGTGIVTFGNTVVVGNRRMFSTANPDIVDPFAFGVNNQLERRGADIVALFGVAGGIDYAGVIRNYVDPKTSKSPRDYIPALQSYLQTLGYAPMSRADAWTTFTGLRSELRQIFADKVFVSEIKLPGQVDGCCYKDYSVAYSMINTLFPASSGYTDNNVTGNAKPTLRATGNLDLLHATIKTLQSASTGIVNPDGTTSAAQVGGDIMLLGPGGNINVGTTAAENNTKLSNSSLGILTLDNGAINIFTDASVLVNQSRVLTVQGGDILMFSSNGDLDAGRGAKTTVDFKPLLVNFDSANLQTINLNGLVSGAGIGTIRSTPDAPAASASLIAPRGTVNAGDAGLRSSGNLDILALLVLNAANIAVAGSVSGVPEVSSVNLGALESTSSTGGQAARIADESVAAAASRGAQTGVRTMPSLVTVEVLGFGDCDPESGRVCTAN